MSEGSANPLTLTQEELLDAMRGSGGYVCFAYHGMGWTTYLRWHPDLQQFEAITTRRRATLEDGEVVVNTEVSDHWSVTPSTVDDFIPENPTAPTEMQLDVVQYEQTPFPDAGAPDAEWQSDQTAEGTRVL